MSDYDENQLITAMVAREVSALYPASTRSASTMPIMKVTNLRRAPEGPAISFELYEGEILGIGGLLGSGRSELLLAIFGAESIASGEIEVAGKKVYPRGPRTMMSAGIGLLTEDRKVLGILPELSIRENVTIASLRRGSRMGLLPPKEQVDEADKLLDSLRLRAGSYEQPVSTLSGGNQQKVLLARWLLTKPKILVFDEPTKGIDVGAKGEIYKVIGDLAGEGLGIIVVSSYLPELLGLADRVLVLRGGAVAGELGRAASEEDVLRLASGHTGAQEVAEVKLMWREEIPTTTIRSGAPAEQEPSKPLAGNGAAQLLRPPHRLTGFSRSAMSQGARAAGSWFCSWRSEP